MTAICEEHTFSKPHFDFVMQLFSAVGRVAVVPEKLFDGVIAVSGSSPAYLYMMLEAMGDAAVREGLPRKTAYEMAAQSMVGAAKMLLETGEHPGMLKDAVCSPAGTTIEAVAAPLWKPWRSVQKNRARWQSKEKSYGKCYAYCAA